MSGGRVIVTHLYFAIWLQQLSDRHLVLLQTPLHQFGAAHVNGTLHVGGIELGKRPAVDDEQPARSSLDEACQALDVHGAAFGGTLFPSHDVNFGSFISRGAQTEGRRVEEEEVLSKG